MKLLQRNLRQKDPKRIHGRTPREPLKIKTQRGISIRTSRGLPERTLGGIPRTAPKGFRDRLWKEHFREFHKNSTEGTSGRAKRGISVRTFERNICKNSQRNSWKYT